MLKSKSIFSLFCILVLSVSAWGQTRMIAHVSKESGGFIPGLIFANTDHGANHTITVMPYTQDGIALDAVTVAVDAGVTLYQTVLELFGSTEVSHFLINGDSDIEVNITYQSVQDLSSPVHIHESDVQSSAQLLVIVVQVCSKIANQRVIQVAIRHDRLALLQPGNCLITRVVRLGHQRINLELDGIAWFSERSDTAIDGGMNIGI